MGLPDFASRYVCPKNPVRTITPAYSLSSNIEGRDFRFGERLALSMSHDKSPVVIIPQ